MFSHSPYKNEFKKRFINLFKVLFDYFIPNKKDKFSGVVFKIAFFAVLFAFVFSACSFSLYFYEDEKQAYISQNAKKIWYSKDFSSNERFEALSEETPNFAGWIKINNTYIDSPFYQTDNDEYYLNRNSRGEESRHGALFLSSEDNISSSAADKNLVIYGHNMPDGSMFGSLKKFRNLNFYKENPAVLLSTPKGERTYVIYAIFLLNSDPAHDNGYIYYAQKSEFTYEDEFKAWAKEALSRSIIKTGIDVEYGDSILTLITEADDFEGARLVVMARQLREDESNIINTSQAVINAKAQYPEKWYASHK